MKCLLIGCGRMGSAILKGILKNEYMEENFSIIDPISVVDPVIKGSKVKSFSDMCQHGRRPLIPQEMR